MTALQIALGALVAGSWAFCLLVVIAAWRYRAAPAPAAGGCPPVTVMKPLCGAEEGLEDHLRSVFTQDYPQFEILFAVHEASDPAAAVVEKLQAEYPRIAARLIITGEPPRPNRKAYSLEKMLEAARYGLLVMSDSDVRLRPGALRRIAAELTQPGVGVATCPYRAVPGRGFWSALEALGVNTDFLSGVLAARLVEGMRFAIGPTLAARREVIGKIGGFARFRDYLAEDYLMGKYAAEAGYEVVLSKEVVDHSIGGGGFTETLRHRLRWMRSSRRSLGAAYAGQVFTYPLPLALIAAPWLPWGWAWLAAAALFRAAAAWAAAGWILRDPLTARLAWALPLQDLLGFGTWLAGFFGSRIRWRGRDFVLHKDGRFEPAGFGESRFKRW